MLDQFLCFLGLDILKTIGLLQVERCRRKRTQTCNELRSAKGRFGERTLGKRTYLLGASERPFTNHLLQHPLTTKRPRTEGFPMPRLLLLSVGLLFISLTVACSGDTENSSSRSHSGKSARVDSTSPAESASETSDRPGTSDTSSTPDTNSPRSDSLTDAERSRLGPVLRRLITGDTTEAAPIRSRRLEPVGKRDGKEVYSVLIDGTGASTLQEAGLSHVSEAGGLVTARLTADQIRQAASIEDVRRIRVSKQARSY